MSFLNIQSLTGSSKMLGNAVSQGKSFFEYNGKTIYFNLGCEEDYRKAYLQCAPLKAVINRRAQMFVNGQVKILNKNNGNDLRGEFAKSLQNLLDRPNVLQTFRQWKAQHNIYVDLFGYCPVLKITPVGMPGVIKALWNIPPWLFDIDFAKGNWYDQFDLLNTKTIYEQFYITWRGEKRKLDMDNVFLVLDNTIGTDNDGNLLMPDSRVKSLEYDISNDTAAKMTANSLITKKGAIGILSNIGKDAMGQIPLNPKEKDNVQADFRRYGFGQEWQVIITDAALQWQSMSFPMRDMMLFETMTASMANICDGMGMYSYIMASKIGVGTTFANLNEAKKSQYQDFIIPDDEARTEQLSRGLIPVDVNAYLSVDYSHIEVLQESKQQQSQALKAEADALTVLWDAGLLTRNDMREKLGEDRISGVPEFDMYKFQLAPTQLQQPTTNENEKVASEGIGA